MLRRVLTLTAVVLLTVATAQAEATRVLYLNKSAGFQHSVVAHTKGVDTSHSETIMKEITDAMGAELTSTKDASLINAENLKNYDVVIFYTTGDLTEPGTDGTTPMGENGVQELLEWIHAGGGFMGFHCASDTFHRGGDSPESPYLDMLGGEFAGHGPQFYGTLKVVDPDHPTMAGLPAEYKIKEEWYYFTNLMKDNMHVLALLHPGQISEKDERYNIPDYPAIWCSAAGDGRVYYNAMGHREEVWSDPPFQQAIRNAITWAKGEGETAADPNYADVVPEEMNAEDE